MTVSTAVISGRRWLICLPTSMLTRDLGETAKEHTIVTVIGLDLSLTSTGVARIDGSDATVARVVSKPAASTLAARSARLRSIAAKVTGMCAGAGLVVVEGPAYASKSGAAHDRAGYWWLVVAELTATGVPVVEVPPATLKVFATGRGNAGKDDVLTAVVRRYPHVEFAGNDEADALVLAAMGCRLLGAPLEASLPQTHLRAMEKVKYVRSFGV